MSEPATFGREFRYVREVGREDWYRTPEWAPEDQADFEARLRRARPWSRPQYLRIKGLALEDGNDQGAEGLWLRVLDEYPDDVDAVSAREHLADLSVRRGHLADAEGLYRRILVDAPDGSGTSGLVLVKLAEVLTASGRPQEAMRLLASVDMEELSVFTSSLFRWYVAHSEAAMATGDVDVASADAAHALWLAEQPSQYSRHPGVGVVTADDDLLSALRRLAADKQQA